MQGSFCGLKVHVIKIYSVILISRYLPLNSFFCIRSLLFYTVNEQLFLTKSRCPINLYIASKPDKFWIKFWLAAYSKSTFLLKGFTYVAEDDRRPATRSTHVVVEPFAGKGLNVRTDIFSIPSSYLQNLKLKRLASEEPWNG